MIPKYNFNNPNLKIIRKTLRKNQTEAEKLLWSKLRNKQINNLKFFRQYSIGRFILDFYCPQNRLAIEIDGGQHNEKEKQIYDQKRTEYLKRQGIKIIRFWNNEVADNIEGVFNKIKEELIG